MKALVAIMMGGKLFCLYLMQGFPDSSVGEETTCNTGNSGSIPGLGRFAREGIGYPLQYSWASLVAQLVKKKSTCNVGDPSSIPGLGRSPGEGKGYPLQYSGLENSMDCIAFGVAKSWTRLSDFHMQGQDAISVGSYSGTGGNDFLRGSQPSHASTLGCIGVCLCCCCCPAAQLCLTLQHHGPQQPSFPVLHHLPMFAQIHVHWVSDTL